MSKESFIKDIAKYICKYSPEYNIKCNSAVIAQAILESGWGESSLAAKYHNYFGMKCGTLWKGKSVNMQTQEEYTPGVHTTITDNFRVYDSMEEGVKGYFEFIQMQRYQNLRGITDPRKYLQTISDDGYATSSTYVESCMSLVNSYNLTAYDKIDNKENIMEDGNKNVVEIATQWMIDLANDDTHGYDQWYRWGEKGDYDCSSAVITAWETAGVPVKTKGATYTGNMKNVFLSCGFKDVTNTVNLSNGSGLIRGDVLLNEVHHVAMYVGNGKEVEASINEKGGATGGKPGDQTGAEVLIKNYRNYPWDCVLRYSAVANVVAAPKNVIKQKENISTRSAKLNVPYLKKGSNGLGVYILQAALNIVGNYYLDVDGEFGINTENAVKEYQKSKRNKPNGIFGLPSFRCLLEDIVANTYVD